MSKSWALVSVRVVELGMGLVPALVLVLGLVPALVMVLGLVPAMVPGMGPLHHMKSQKE